MSLRVQYFLLAERIFFLSILLMLCNLGRIVLPTTADGTGGVWFKYIVWLTYAFLFCIPLYLILLCAGNLLGLRSLRGTSLRTYPIRTTIFCIVAIVGLFATQAMIYADGWVYAIFQFHLNGFVLNLLMTPGGLTSMDMSKKSTLGFEERLLVVLLIQGVILVMAMRSRWLRWVQERLLKGYKPRLVFSVVLVVLILGQAIGYGLSRAVWYRPVLRVAEAIPFYIPITFNHLARSCGWSSTDANLPAADDSSSLHCPQHPLALRPDSPRYNIMVLMCETLRADMLTPEIMPQTFAFASQNIQFKHHYSSGNSTREGVFGAMTGLHGTYWRNMLRDNLGSSIVKFLQDNGYEMELFTSQSFSYPEFDRTVFATVPRDHMHVRSDAPPWQRDRDNVSDMIQWLSTRDRTSPFMTFMFFESSHARYAFPPESVIRPDYCECFDYATDLINPSPHQVLQVFNRYINAVHHLDSQLGRLMEYLNTSGQLDNTIVIITGDHGDAFYEKERWGHGGNSFLEEVIHVPLVMHIPGVPPQVKAELTSHVDIFPTALAVLGIKNPPADYSVGRDLMHSPSQSPYVVCSGWDSLALITEKEKYVMPYHGFRLPEAFSRIDQSREEKEERRILHPQLLNLMSQMRQFLKR